MSFEISGQSGNKLEVTTALRAMASSSDISIIEQINIDRAEHYAATTGRIDVFSGIGPDPAFQFAGQPGQGYPVIMVANNSPTKSLVMDFVVSTQDGGIGAGAANPNAFIRLKNQSYSLAAGDPDANINPVSSNPRRLNGANGTVPEDVKVFSWDNAGDGLGIPAGAWNAGFSLAEIQMRDSFLKMEFGFSIAPPGFGKSSTFIVLEPVGLAAGESIACQVAMSMFHIDLKDPYA